MADALPVDSNDLTGVILAGGLGTRLRPVIADRPKCLAPINGRPFLFYLLQQFVHAGVSRLILCTGYGGSQVQAAVGSSFAGIKVEYSHETEPLGTAGALRLATATHPEKQHWLVTNGDSYFGFDIRGYIRGFQDSGLHAGLAAARVSESGRFGSVRWTDRSQISSFEEKTGAPVPGWINAGVYLLGSPFREQLPNLTPASLERDVFPNWIDKGIYLHAAQGHFIDIGVPASYENAPHFFSSLAA